LHNEASSGLNIVLRAIDVNISIAADRFAKIADKRQYVDILEDAQIADSAAWCSTFSRNRNFSSFPKTFSTASTALEA